MARYAVAAGFAVIGFIIGGGPQGAMLGWSIGSVVGGLLFPEKQKPVIGPRLQDANVQTSTFGNPIPHVWGSFRVAGSIIWMTKIVEVMTKKKQKKVLGIPQGPKVYEFKYYGNFSVVLCAGPVLGINRIWADGVQIHANDPTLDPMPEYRPFITTYFGDETQTESPLMAMYDGAGKHPAYRGYARVDFGPMMPLEKFFNRIPQFTFEVWTKPGRPPVDYVYDESHTLGNVLYGKFLAGWSIYGDAVFWRHPNDYEFLRYRTGAYKFLSAAEIAQSTPTVGDSSWYGNGFQYGTTNGVGVVGNGQYIIALQRAFLTSYRLIAFEIGPNQTARVAGWRDLTNTGSLTGDVPTWNNDGITVMHGGFQTLDDELYFIDQTSRIFFDPYLHESVRPRILHGITLGEVVGHAGGTPLTFQVFDKGFEMDNYGQAGALGWRPGWVLPVNGVDYWFLYVPKAVMQAGGGTSLNQTPLYAAFASARPNGAILGAPMLSTGAWVDFTDLFVDTDGNHVVPFTDVNVPSTDPYDYTNSAVFPRLVGTTYYFSLSRPVFIRGLAYTYQPFNTRVFTHNLITGAATQIKTFFDYEAFQFYQAGEFHLSGPVDEPRPLIMAYGTYFDGFNRVYAAGWYPFTFGESYLNWTRQGICAIFVTLVGREDAPGPVKLRDIISDICDKVGLGADMYDVEPLGDTLVRGYCATNQGAARQVIEPLQAVWLFDGVESDGKVKFVYRNGAPIATLDVNALGAQSEKKADQSPRMTEHHLMDAEMTQRLVLRYSSLTYNYQMVTTYWQRDPNTQWSKDMISVEVPIVLTADEAQHAAEMNVIQTWVARDRYEWEMPLEYVKFDCGDTITAQWPKIGGGTVSTDIYITDMTLGEDGVVAFKGSKVDSLTYTASSLPGIDVPAQPPLPPDPNGPMLFLPIDGPLLTPDMNDSPVVLLAVDLVSGGAAYAASVYESDDGGETFDYLGDTPGPATIGAIQNYLPANGFNNKVIDRNLVLSVKMHRSGLSLSSCTELEMLNGANRLLISAYDTWYEPAWELIGFCNAAPTTTPGVYTISKILRGIQGTDYYGTARPGDVVEPNADTLFVADMRLDQIGEDVTWWAQGIDDPEPTPALIAAADERTITETYQQRPWRPLAPCHIRGSRDDGGNLLIKWVPRARMNVEIVDGKDTVIDEPIEQYRILFLPSARFGNSFFGQVASSTDYLVPSKIRRTVIVNQPEFVYTREMAIEDHGEPLNFGTVMFAIQQYSPRVGYGEYARGAL